MADQGMWFKLWIGADEDPDLGNFSLADFGRWCKFGLYLKKYGNGGIIELKPPCLPLQHKFEVVSFDAVISVIVMFPNCAVTGETNVIVTWNNWQKYQGDNSKERVRRFRERVTAKKRREEMRRDERRGDDISEAPKRKNKAPFPDNFVISETLALWCEQQHISDTAPHLEAFRDYHIAKGSRFIDWDAAFRTWIRNASKFGSNANRPRSQTEGELSERTMRILRRGL